MKKLFEPLRLRDLTIRNRIFVSPMCQYSAVDGVAQAWHMVHLGARATGGAGLVMVEATGVEAEGRISPGCLGLWSEPQSEALEPIVDFIKSQGAAAAIQLAHAGRKASVAVPWRGGRSLSSETGGWATVAPSAREYSKDFPVPRALAKSEMDALVEKFVEAARRADKAGFDVIEIHMAHGYLLHEFLSPLSNVRDDEYGGSLENRMRFPLRVTRAVRDAWPAEKPLFVRISGTDWVDGGWDIDQSVIFGRELKAAGVDLVDVSSGGLSPLQRIPVEPGFQVPLAARVRAEAGVPTGAVGLITEPEQAESILARDQADAIFLARELLRDPHWPLRAARVLGVDIDWPIQYERAR